MAPVVRALAAADGIESRVCVTGQHRQMLDQVLALFDIAPDNDLQVMMPDQTLNGLFVRIVSATDALLRQWRPDCVLVHGDTTTASAAALAAFHLGVPVGHVEAGLRTGDIQRPFPEEANRRMVDVLSTLMFAPTLSARRNLEAEHLSGRIVVTGNTVIDALALISARLDQDAALSARISRRFPFLQPEKPLVLVTGHRRENIGDGFVQICRALAEIAQDSSVQVVYPVHLNPRVRQTVMPTLVGHTNIHLIEPLDYLDFIWMMKRATLILTDSGGIQEEAPFLGKPVLVLRDVTERPEAVSAGVARLVGTDRVAIVAATRAALAAEPAADNVSPYGDGHAAARIVDVLCGRQVAEFQAASSSIGS